MPYVCGWNHQRSLIHGIVCVLVAVFVFASEIPPTLGWVLSPPSSSSSSSSRSRSRSLGRSSTILAMSASNDENNNSVRVLGVCGGIGSGKSTACKLLVSSCRCLDHIDADSVAHSVYAPGSQAVKDVVAEFGTGILVASGSGSNGEEQNERPEEIDRKKLGAIVFAEKSAMSKLEAIVWPHVKVALEHKIETLKQEWASATTDTNTDTATDDERRPVVVLEAAVLLDAGWDDVVDGIWAVTVPGEVALNRLVETRGLTPEEAAKRIDAQASCRGIGNVPEEVDNGVVTGVIVNDGSLDDLKRALETSLDDPDCWKK